MNVQPNFIYFLLFIFLGIIVAGLNGKKPPRL